MSNENRKPPTIGPGKPRSATPPDSVPPAAQPASAGTEAEPEIIIESFAASDEVSPFVPASAGEGADAGVESAQGIEQGVEWAGTDRPERIDPDRGGKPQI